MTSDEAFRAARRAFEALADLPEEERAAGLAALDPRVRPEVEALLRADADPRPIEPLREVLPEQLGGYRIVRELGRGGMGVVYEAEEASPRRRVALKVLHPWLRAAGVDAIARGEAQALADVRHPGIPAVYALVDTERGPAVAMELVVGEPFGVAVARLAPRARVELLARLCAAVGAAHAHGVVHRDLKPANLVIAPDGQPRVLDFGLARGVGTDGHGGGTPPYMAPEQGDGGASAAADVHALGVIGWEALTGGLPGEGAERDLREDLRAVLRRAMAPAPADRYADARALGAELRRALADHPVEAQTGAGPRMRAWARRHRRGVVAAGVAFVGMAALLASGPWIRLTIGDALAERRAAALEQPGMDAATRAAALESLLTDPGHVGSPTLVRLWYAEGRAAEDEDERLTALAAAWIHAESPEPELIDALEAALRDTGHTAAAEAVASSAEGTLGAVLARWDLTDPAIPLPLRASLATLSKATPLPDLAPRFDLDPRGTWSHSDTTLWGPSGELRSAGPVSDLVTLPDGRLLVAHRIEPAGIFLLAGNRETPWHAGTVAQELPIRKLDLGDLDGDGRPEVVAGATGWKAHELRVFDDTGRLRARGRLAAWDVAVADGTVWVVGGPIPETPAPHGPRRFLVPVRLEGEDLKAGTPFDLGRDVLALAAADLDGVPPAELVLRADDALGVVSGGEIVWIPGLDLRRVEVGEDGRARLRVFDGVRDWRLGEGEVLPLRSSRALPAVESPAEFADPRRRGAWSRAAALAALGAVDAVAPRLVELARGGSAETREAALGVLLPVDADGAPTVTRVGGATTRAAAELLATLPDSARARALVRRAHAVDGPGRSDPKAAINLGGPLPDWVAVGASGTVHRDPLHARLGVELAASDPVALSFVVEPTGELTCVDWQLSVERIDWAAGLTLRFGTDELVFWRTGGGAREGHRLGLGGPGPRASASVPLSLGPHRISYCRSTDPVASSARLDDLPREIDRTTVTTGPFEVSLGPATKGPYDLDRSVLIALEGIEVRGGRFVEDPRGDPGARRFAEQGEGSTAPRARALTAGALLGPAEVRALPAADRRWLLRHDPATWEPVLTAALGDGFFGEWADAWDVPVGYRDPWAMPSLVGPSLARIPLDHPLGPAVALARAEALLQAGQVAAARALLATLPAATPAVAVARARLALRSGHPEAVATAFTEAAARSPAPEAVRDAFADDPELAPLVPAPAAPDLFPP